MCVISFVGSSSTVAILFISVLLLKSFTLTWNSNVLVCPAFKYTSIPLYKSVDVYHIDEPPIFILPSTKLVPVGIMSFTLTVVGAVPVLLFNSI